MQPVGAWMAKDGGVHANVVYRQGMDARMFPVGKAITAEARERLAPKVRAAVVPGYIGISTAEDERGRFCVPWEPQYEAGTSAPLTVYFYSCARSVFGADAGFERLRITT